MASRYSKGFFIEKDKMRLTYIYIIWDPRNNNKCYIGKSDDPFKRLKEHLKISLKKQGRLSIKEAWIKSLINKGLEPILEILDEVSLNTKEEWRFWEQHYISLYKSWEFNLTNDPFHLGGEGFGSGSQNPSRQPEIIEKAKQSRKKRYGVPPFYYICPNPTQNSNCRKILSFRQPHILRTAIKNCKLCISCSHLGIPVWNKGLTKETSETVNKIAMLKKGKPRSEETKKKISLNSPKLPPWNKGKEHPTAQQRPVLQINSSTREIKEFNTIKEALLSFEIVKNTSQIANAIKRKGKFKNYYWEYKKGGNCGE